MNQTLPHQDEKKSSTYFTWKIEIDDIFTWKICQISKNVFHLKMLQQILLRVHSDRGWRKCLGCLILIGHFPQKNPIISGSFAKRDLQLKASYEVAGLFSQKSH